MSLATWQAVLVLVLVVVGLFALMWRGWRGRAGRHDLPELVSVPPDSELSGSLEPELAGGARYFGTTVAGEWLDRVVARGLGSRSSCRLTLSPGGLDVVRPAGSFRIPATALLGARHEQGIAGKVVPPHGLMVVTWQHGDLTLDSGFRMTEFDLKGSAKPGDAHTSWITAIITKAKENA